MKFTVFLDNKITPYRTEEKSLSFRNKKKTHTIEIKQKENKKIIPYANVLCNRRSSGMNSIKKDHVLYLNIKFRHVL